MTRSEALQVLGLTAQATIEDVKKAYRKRAVETHPDRGGNSKDFQRVNAAYKYLTKHGTAGGPYVGNIPMADLNDQFRSFADALRRDRQRAKRHQQMSPEEIAAMKESVLQSDLLIALESVGAFTFNVHGHVFQKRGIPDVYIGHPYWTGWLEIKIENRELTTLQRIRLNDLVKRHIPAMVLRWRSKSGDWGEPGLVAQSEDSVHLAVLPATVWKQSKGQERGKALINFLRKATLTLATINGHRVGDFYPQQQGAKIDVYA